MSVSFVSVVALARGSPAPLGVVVSLCHPCHTTQVPSLSCVWLAAPPYFPLPSAGVDVPDVRVVLKWRLGDDVGEMLNEIGRASRDGQDARIV